MAVVAEPSRKTGAAALSVASNFALIVVKIVAGVLTGSVAILTEAVHSGIDLLVLAAHGIEQLRAIQDEAIAAPS